MDEECSKVKLVPTESTDPSSVREILSAKSVPKFSSLSKISIFKKWNLNKPNTG